MKPFSFVLLALWCSVAFGQNYNIIRRVINAGQPDLVQIPPSSCHDNGTTECTMMDGRRYSVCQCTCDKRDSDRYFYKSTFGFFNSTWKCEKNSALRRRSGCQLSLDFNGLNEPIPTVPTTINHSFSRLISNVTTISYTSIPEEATCSLKTEKSMYLTCFGEWKQLNNTLVTKRFHIDYHFRDIIKIQVDYTESSSYPLPSGRIIKLAVTCSHRPWEPSQCILLKIQGQLQCPVSSPHPTTPPALPPVVHPSVPSLRTSQASTTSPSSWKPGGNINAPRKDSSIVFSTGLIIGISLSGVALLAALIILLFFIIRLRKRRFINNDRKASTAELILENTTYGERVAGAQKPTHRFEEQADPEGQRIATEVLEMQEEPMYSIPGPNINKDNSEQDEPFYHVLEEPQPHGTKKHEMHEDLQTNTAPHVYGTFNEPHQTNTSSNALGYNNTLYDSVGGIIKQESE